MRNIQIERKLFEIFGYKFFVFENFQDADLNIDDEAIYQQDNQDELVDVFAANRFFSIWCDESRVNATLICAREGHLAKILSYLKKIGLQDEDYSTATYKLCDKPSVLYVKSQEGMDIFMNNINAAILSKMPATFNTKNSRP